MKKLENWQDALANKWIFKKSKDTFYYTLYNPSTLEIEYLNQGYEESERYNPLANIKAGVNSLLVARWLEGKLHIESYEGSGNSEDFLVRVDEKLNPLYEVPPIVISEGLEVRWGYGKTHTDINEAVSYFIKLIKTFDNK